MKLVVPDQDKYKPKKIYEYEVAPCNVPVRVVSVGKLQEHVSVGQIIIIVDTGRGDRFVLGHNGKDFSLHSPTYDIHVELADEIKKLELVF